MWFDVMYVLLGGVIGACAVLEWTRSKRIAAQRQREKDNGELNALRLRPVSYTHLTLPTNREV